MNYFEQFSIIKVYQGLQIELKVQIRIKLVVLCNQVIEIKFQSILTS